MGISALKISSNLIEKFETNVSQEKPTLLNGFEINSNFSRVTFERFKYQLEFRSNRFKEIIMNNFIQNIVHSRYSVFDLYV